MKSASIRTVQHQLAALIAEVEKGGEIVITRHRQPVARLLPVGGAAGAGVEAGTPAAIRRYWQRRPALPSVRSDVTHAALVADGRGTV